MGIKDYIMMSYPLHRRCSELHKLLHHDSDTIFPDLVMLVIKAAHDCSLAAQTPDQILMESCSSTELTKWLFKHKEKLLSSTDMIHCHTQIMDEHNDMMTSPGVSGYPGGYTGMGTGTKANIGAVREGLGKTPKGMEYLKSRPCYKCCQNVQIRALPSVR